MKRAYSTFVVKEIDDEKRIITGIASTPSTDRHGDIVEPAGAVYTLPIPLLWQHDHHDPIGWVTAAKVTKKGIEIVAEIARDVTDDIENKWKKIKSGLVRGLSIGFRGLDIEEIPHSWGVIFQKWEWLELSAVTIPANMDASITSVKKFDETALAASGRKSGEVENRPGVSGKSNSVNLRQKDAQTMSKYAEQITALENKRAANVSRMEEILGKTVEEGRSTDDAEREEFDGLQSEVEAIDADLKRFRAIEKTAVQTAKPVAGIKTVENGSQVRGAASIQVKSQKLDKGIEFARLARVKGLSYVMRQDERAIAKGLYGEDSVVHAIVTKANVVAGASLSGNWAEDLVGEESSVFADFIEFLRPMTILGRFGNNGIPGLRSIPFRTRLIGQTGGGQAYWVGEGKPKPLTAFDFNATSLDELKVATISVVTEELLRKSSPSADAILRDSLAAAVAERIDRDFIDPAKSASAGVSPASITNAVTPIVSSGNDADAIRHDVRRLLATFVAASNPPTAGVWIMSSVTALSLSLMTNALGQTEFPGISMTGGTFQGMPVIVSEYVPTVSAGGYVILANASDIYFADEGGVMIDVSREASLQMLDNPTNDSVTPTPTSMVSMWQTNSVAFRAERILNWAKRRASAVAVLSQVNWGAPES